jgi:integrase
VIPITTEQTLAIRDAVPDELRAMVTLAAGTGMRQSELFGLTLDRIDFLRRTVTVDRQLLSVPGRGAAFGPPKTKASIRTIPLPQVVVDALAEHLSAFPAVENGRFAGLVFHRNGEPWTRQAFGHIWRPVVKAAGLAPRTGSHALRHYYASLLIRHGESVKTVQARLGHASASETLDTYSHLWPDSEDRTRDAVDSVLGNLADYLRTEEASES